MKFNYSIQDLPIDHMPDSAGWKGIFQEDALIAYVSYEITSTENEKWMHLHMIEVLEKGKGHGTKCISFLFEQEGIDWMFGTVKFDSYAIAYSFWLSLGAEMNVKNESEYWKKYQEDENISFTLNLNTVRKETVLDEWT